MFKKGFLKTKKRGSFAAAKTNRVNARKTSWSKRPPVQNLQETYSSSGVFPQVGPTNTTCLAHKPESVGVLLWALSPGAAPSNFPKVSPWPVGDSGYRVATP